MVGKRYKSGTKICVFEKSCWQHREPRAGWLGGWCSGSVLVLARCWCHCRRRHGNIGAQHRPQRRPCCGRAQVRQPVIMVGATASGPSCKKIGRRDLSRGERKARRAYMRGSDWLNVRQKACRCNLQSSGRCDGWCTHSNLFVHHRRARTSAGSRLAVDSR